MNTLRRVSALMLLAALPLTAAEEAAAATAEGREFLFAAPEWLWALLLLLPLLFLRRRAGAVAAVTHPTIRFAADKMARPSTLAGRIGPLLFVAAAACLILALARPQWLNRHEEQKVSGIDIMIACDLSGSMSMQDMIFTVEDERGRSRRVPIDRLTAAKHVINEFIEGRPNDRIGLVGFAGKAKLCSPLTLDHGLVRHIISQFYLASADRFGRERAGYIEEDGTAIGTAIASAATRLNARKETKSKVIILVTDGINNRGSLAPTEAAKQAAELGITIFTIAIGQDERISRYTADVDTFDSKTLKEIAHSTGGKYYHASSGEKLQRAFAQIDRLEKTDAKRRVILSYEELFYLPLGLAALLLALGIGLNYTLPRPAP
ncbi:MAG: VWA domain-containing protein [Akkermansia sp.]|nr:VWA domain-containing protein [Akkermansia sp.]